MHKSTDHLSLPERWDDPAWSALLAQFNQISLFGEQLTRAEEELSKDGWRPPYTNVDRYLASEGLDPIDLARGSAIVRIQRLWFVLADLYVSTEKMPAFMDAAAKGPLYLSEIGPDIDAPFGELSDGWSRASLPATDRKPFFLYIDEFQSFTTESIANMISELRKYGVGLILAHQHLFQLEPAVRHAVLGNVGTMIAFRVGVEDAQLLEKEFQPEFGWQDLINLRNYDIYIKLLIDGMPSRPFSATTFPPRQLH